MLGSATIYAKSNNSQRRRIDTPMKNDVDKLIKENKRKIHMTSLANKYFNKITEAVIKSISQGNTSINFYYNYYDFVNERLGKPQGFLNDFMDERGYLNSEFMTNDCNGNPMTFKTLFGANFNWEFKGKNKMIITW